MKEYTGDKIRNVAIVGHGGAGTTSVTEALLYRSGAISRMCKVEARPVNKLLPTNFWILWVGQWHNIYAHSCAQNS